MVSQKYTGFIVFIRIMLVFSVYQSICFPHLFSQVTREWVQRFNGTDNRFDIANTIKLDANSNIYLSGSTASAGTSTDILALKYSPSGVVLWQAVFNGISDNIDQANGSFLDNSGNFYITGYTSDTNDILKIITLKYSSSGALLWSKVFLPPGYNQGLGQAVISDNSSNVFTCGYIRRPNGSYTLLVLKYSSAGNLLDSARFNVSSSSSEVPASICADNGGNIYVLASTNALSGSNDILMLKYNNTPDLLWQNTFSGTAAGSDIPVQLLLGGDSKLIVSAAMYNSSGGLDYGTYRFDTNSTLIMQHIYNGTGNNQDIPYSIAKDAMNNIYVTGSSRNSDTLGSEDFLTLKLHPTGQLLWQRRFNGTGNGIDYGTSVAVDNSGNVFAGGTTDKHDVHLAFALIKYNAAGDLNWLEEYSVQERSEDFIYTVAVDNSYNIFVTGISFDSTSDYDIATIKYSEPIGIEQVSAEVPVNFMLYRNFPNPFNPETTIRFDIPANVKREMSNGNGEMSNVRLMIYDITGKEIAELVNSELPAGRYEVDWDGSDHASGIYFCKLLSGEFAQTLKMILVR